MGKNNYILPKSLKRASITYLCLPLLMLFCSSCGATQANTVSFQQASTPITVAAHQAVPYLKGKTTSLSWITGHDCQQGMQAYQLSDETNPDAALVGTGWIDPTNGQLI